MAQFPPPAGQPGSTAIPADSSCFIAWANGCTVTRGYVNLADTTFTYEGHNRAFYGNDTDAVGIPDETVVSLGDRGEALVTFPETIGNGPGFDFAVFENSISDDFLELAFVEVSSDGVRFVRFPAETNVPPAPQIPTFGSIDATLINNFAGKYRARFGTPFDLADIADSTGIDLQHITHVRLIDVGGCIQPGLSTFDSKGNIVNDPWPTPFHSCGFDLDAVGVIHAGTQGINTATDPYTVTIYPNPATDHVTVAAGRPFTGLSILNADGRSESHYGPGSGAVSVSLEALPAGIYLCRVVFSDGMVKVLKFVKN